MPQHIDGIAESITDARFDIEASQEARLLEQAKSAGIPDEEIGAFYVILVSGLPANIDANGYDIFSEEELIIEAGKHEGWFYDIDGKRLIGTVPPAKTIINRMRTS